MDWSLVRNAGEASLLLAESLAYIVKCTTFMYARSSDVSWPISSVVVPLIGPGFDPRHGVVILCGLC